MVTVGEILSTAQVSRETGIPEATLRYWRFQKIGPRSFRLGPRKVAYKRQDVEAWLERQYNAEGDPAA